METRILNLDLLQLTRQGRQGWAHFQGLRSSVATHNSRSWGYKYAAKIHFQFSTFISWLSRAVGRIRFPEIRGRLIFRKTRLSLP